MSNLELGVLNVKMKVEYESLIRYARVQICLLPMIVSRQMMEVS